MYSPNPNLNDIIHIPYLKMSEVQTQNLKYVKIHSPNPNLKYFNSHLKLKHNNPKSKLQMPKSQNPFAKLQSHMLDCTLQNLETNPKQQKFKIHYPNPNLK